MAYWLALVLASSKKGGFTPWGALNVPLRLIPFSNMVFVPSSVLLGKLFSAFALLFAAFLLLFLPSGFGLRAAFWHPRSLIFRKEVHKILKERRPRCVKGRGVWVWLTHALSVFFLLFLPKRHQSADLFPFINLSTIILFCATFF